MREMLAAGAITVNAYSPKSPTVTTAPAPDQQQQQNQQMLGVYPNTQRIPAPYFYPAPYSYQPQGYYAPAPAAYSYNTQVNPIYAPGAAPVRPVPAMSYSLQPHPSMNPHAPAHVPSTAKGPAPASPATAAPAAESAPVAATNGAAATTAQNPSANGTALPYSSVAATPAATPAATAPAATTSPAPATTATPPATAPSASTPNASTISSLMIPKDTRSALNTSAEISLQPPIKKAKASAAANSTATATAASTKPEETKSEPAAAPVKLEEKPAAAATPVKATEPTKAAEPAKTASPAPLTAAEVVKAAAAAANNKEAKAAAAAKPVAKPEEPKPNSLKESFDINFEVEDHLKKPAKSTAAKTVEPAKTEAPKMTAAQVAAAANASPAPASGDAKVASEVKPEAKVEKTEPVSSATAVTNGTAVSTPTKTAPAMVLPASIAASPQPYKATAQDQMAAKKSDNVAGPPPGLLTYTAEQLMAFSVLAKANPAPITLQKALDRTTINSPGGRQAGKGGPGGGKGPRGGSRREDKLKAGPPPTVVRPMGIEPGSIEAKSRTFRGILNKITPEKFDKLVGKMLEVPVENTETLAALVDIIADVSVREMKFCAMYASLCAQIAQALPSFEVVHPNDEKPSIVNFRTVMLTKCQNLFSARHPIRPVPDDIVDPEQRQEWELKQNKIRSSMLGLVKFLGELANQNVLAAAIIPIILDDLFTARLGYDDLELYTILLSTYGKQLGPNVHPYLQKCRDWIAEYISREKDKQDSEGTRIRYLMQDTIDLAENNWVHRSVSSAAQGPKTLAEIHDDIARNERQKEADLKASKKPFGRLAQPLPSKTPSRGPPPSILQRDAPPRTPSSPSQGGRGKSGFAQNTLSPARGAPATPSSSGLTSPSILSNAFDSLSSESTFDPNFLASSTSSAPAEDDGPREAEEMDASTIEGLVEEFLDSNVADEAVETLVDSPALEESCKYFISRLLLKVLDMTTDKKRDWAIDLLQLFLKSEYGLTETDRFVVPGLTQTIAELDSIDLPKAPASLGIIIAECLKRKIVPPHTLNKILAPLQNDSPSRAANVIVSMWSHIPPADVPGLLKQTNFNISNWPVPDEKVPAAMKQSLETVESQLARGEDPLKVAIWAKANNSSAFKSREFVVRIVKRMNEEVNQLASGASSSSSSSSSAPGSTIDESVYTPIIQAVLSNSKFHDDIAIALAEGFNQKPSVGLPLFTLFNKLGLPKNKIADATSKQVTGRENRYDFDPGFNSWFHAGGGAGTASKSSNSKPSKGGKAKIKRK
jgi:translation initiation factor 4G